jgi:hypothetical protein
VLTSVGLPITCCELGDGLPLKGVCRAMLKCSFGRMAEYVVGAIYECDLALEKTGPEWPVRPHVKP